MSKFHKDLKGSELHYARVIPGTGSPVGTITPDINGMAYADLQSGNFYISNGTTSSSWKLISGGGGATANLTGNGSPVGAVTPSVIGQMYVDLVTGDVYSASALTSNGWKSNLAIGGGGNVLELNVLDLGVKGDGTTDDTLTFAAACITAATQKKTLRVPAKTYYITDRIIINNISDLRISCDYGAKILAKSTVKFHMLTFRNCHNITIDGLIFDGGHDTVDVLLDHGAHGLVYDFGSTELTVTNCLFKRIADTAIYDCTQGSFTADMNPSVGDVKDSHLIISNNRFMDCNHCFNTKGGGARFGLIYGNHYIRCNSAVKLDGEMGDPPHLYSKKVSSFLITNNVCHDMGIGNIAGADGQGTGVAVFCLEEGYENVLVEGNEVYGFNSTDAIKIAGGQTNRTINNVRIINNRFTGAVNAYGLRLIGTSNTVVFQNITLEGNEFINSTRGVMYISNTAGCTLQDLLIKNNKFIDWGMPPSAAEKQPNTHAVNAVFNGTNSNIHIVDNKFIRNAVTYSPSQAIKIEGQTILTKQDLIIERNSFVNVNASALAEQIVYLYGSDLTTPLPVIFRDNYVTGTLQLSGVNLEYLDNWVKGTTKISYGGTGGAKSIVYSEGNRLYQGADTYLMRVDQATVYAKNNRYDPAMNQSSVISVITPNGVYNDAGVSISIMSDVDSTNKTDGSFLYWSQARQEHLYGQPADPIIHSPSGIPYRVAITDAGVPSYVTDVVGFATFNGADSTTSPGTPTIGTWSVDQGTFGIRNNMLYSVTDTLGDTISMDAGTNKFRVGADLQGQITGQFRYFQLCFHYLGLNDCFFVRFDTTKAYIYKREGGVAPTTSLVETSHSASSGISQRMQVETANGIINLYIDGVLKLTYTMTTAEQTKFMASTKVALRLQKPTGTPTIDCNADNFRIEKL